MTGFIMASDLEERAATEDPLQSLVSTVAFSSADWSNDKTRAWIYGIILGWDDADEESDDPMPELAAKFGWSPERVARLRRLRAAFSELLEGEAPDA